MISFDFDNMSKRDFIERLELMLGYYGLDSVMIEWRVSANRCGFHVRIFGTPNDYDERLLFGDDEKRVYLDMERERSGLGINVLFDSKIYADGRERRAGEWHVIGED